MRTVLAFMILGLSSPVTAQVDLDMSYTRSAGDIARTNIGNRAVDRSVRGRAPSTDRATREARNVCAQRWQLRARHGAGHPKVRRLLALCEQAGFR